MSDAEVDRIAAAVVGADKAATRLKIADVLRESFDQILDGQRTGRYDWDQLFKTEKTHFGTLVEINLRRAFKQFGDGLVMDYLIDGIEADCKYSQKMYGWMIPREAMNHICLVVTADDKVSKWSMGVVRITEERLREAKNQDKKGQLNDVGKAAIKWLFKDADLPPNVYLQIPAEKVKDILDERKSGAQRVVRLFTHTQGRLVGRAAVATAAQQDDFMKRVRYNGGARDKLMPVGIVIFGHEHQDLAAKLGLPVPSKGEFVSARLVSIPANSPRQKIALDGEYWALAQPGEPVGAAPALPRSPSVR